MPHSRILIITMTPHDLRTLETSDEDFTIGGDDQIETASYIRNSDELPTTFCPGYA